MNATQQHLLDLYRTASHQDPAPPAPGTADLRTLQEVRTWWRFRAVVDERVAAHRARWTALLSRLRPATTPRPAAAPSSPASALPLRPVEPLQQGADRLADVCSRPGQR
ncbi:hypothetical protein [Streptomyces sp. NPDC049555]|uniref:hypothetical protein n=1 Tax=unclassified Streptomyces TaxID=2593676 RepID=UPI0034379FA8